MPSWGVGTGGTRFARFPGPGEPRDIFDKLEDCAVIHRLTGATPTRLAAHPLGQGRPGGAARQGGRARPRLRRDELEHLPDAPGPAALLQVRLALATPTPRSARRRSSTTSNASRSAQAIGSKALTVWIGDGSNFPGQAHFTRAFERYLDAMRAIYAALPDDWRLFTEHKMYEPAFYSTVVQDWGTNYLIAQELGPKAFCLVDLGHHAPNVNIEMIVARLIQFGKLGGFHFNDSKYGDDDLDAGSIDPYRLFLVFNELVDAEARGVPGFHPAHMIDQSHNVTDPIESLMVSAMEIAARLRPGAPRRPRRARRLPGGERRADGDRDAEGRLPHRRRADPGAWRGSRRARAIDPVAAFRALRLPRQGRRRAPGGRRRRRRHRLTVDRRTPKEDGARSGAIAHLRRDHS